MRKSLLLFAALLFAASLFRVAKAQEPVTKEDIAEIKGALEGINESAAEYRGYVDALRKIKITGYVQPQFRLTDIINTPLSNTPFQAGGFSGGAFPANTKNLFQVRRGRLKVNYDNGLTQFVIQIDAIQTGFTTKDAYLSFMEPWTKSFGFQMGIFDRPFGYEISWSSSNRESPERSRLFQTLFPGERELGAKLFYTPPSGPLSMFHADLGIFNGSGPTANEYDNYKDVIGRVGVNLPFTEANAELDFDVSGYFGNVRNNSKFVYTAGDIAAGKGFVVDSAAANQSAGVQRQYIGFDAQFYYDIPSIGGAILRGEYVFGKQPGAAGATNSTVSPSAQPAGALYKREFAGWYIHYIQNVGSHDQIEVKYDVYDPNTKVGASDFTNTNTSGAAGLSATDMKFSTLGFGLVHHWDDNVKIILYYEIVQNEKLSNITTSNHPLLAYANDVPDNVLTFRVQYKF